MSSGSGTAHEPRRSATVPPAPSSCQETSWANCSGQARWRTSTTRSKTTRCSSSAASTFEPATEPPGAPTCRPQDEACEGDHGAAADQFRQLDADATSAAATPRATRSFRTKRRFAQSSGVRRHGRAAELRQLLLQQDIRALAALDRDEGLGDHWVELRLAFASISARASSRLRRGGTAVPRSSRRSCRQRSGRCAASGRSSPRAL